MLAITTTTTTVNGVQKYVIVSYIWPVLGFHLTDLEVKSSQFMLTQLVIPNFSVTHYTLSFFRFHDAMICPFQFKICNLTGESRVNCAGRYSVNPLMHGIHSKCSKNFRPLNDCLEGFIVKYKPGRVVWFIGEILSSLDVGGAGMRVGMGRWRKRRVGGRSWWWGKKYRKGILLNTPLILKIGACHHQTYDLEAPKWLHSLIWQIFFRIYYMQGNGLGEIGVYS